MTLAPRPSQPPDRAALERAVADLLRATGAELDAETAQTPARVAKALLEDLLDGYGRDPVDELRGSLVAAPRKGELVIVAGLEFHSVCPHHLLPYQGRAALGYAADQSVVGFGKLSEALDALAHRLILQEALAHRLCESVMQALAPLGAGVVLSAEHGCMQVRGPKQRQSAVTVEAFAGSFERDAELRRSLARRAGG